ncbi:MAG: HAD-IC family P-type ATPase [Clostridia bacterium]|nr:HAD-IC family P-type ATPase [Clostridia bacterium]
MKEITIKKNIERYTPSTTDGLSIIQVEERKKDGLLNKINKKYSKSYLNIFTNNICTFFNLLGLICFVSLLITKADISQFVFVFFYVANITIGIIQEIRAKRCVDKLSIVANKGTKAIRDGEEAEIPTDQIVLDDVIKLGLGNQIPTDSVILEGVVEVNESLLTGESVPVKKKAGDTLLAGSFITSGICIARADKVGKDNYVETLSAKAKAYKKPNSEIMNSLKLIIKSVGFVIVPIAIALIVKSLLHHQGTFPEAVLGAATVVIGMIPAGMILLTSVTLAVGILKLAKHNTLVQDFYSLEMLARVDTVCFDKTGTITDGKMTVSGVVEINKADYPVDDIISSMLNALQDNNQTALALSEKFGEKCIIKASKTLPFNSSRKLSAVTFENGKTYSFGAPEFVLLKEEYEKIHSKVEEYAFQGLRVLILAVSNKEIEDDNVPTDLSPIAYILLCDNVREDAVDTIRWFKDNGVAIKIISGDNPITVAEVSKRVGVENADKYISLEGLSDKEVYDSANEYTVFGRVSPEQKAILVKALKDNNHVTAMTGDGVNDILALKEADCAISVASGSEAARNVAHLVLLDDNFNSLPKVVFEGRRVINNVESSASLFLMKTIFTMIMAVISLILPYMHTYPFVASQMIPLEFFIIGIPAFFLSLQPNDSRVEGDFISYVTKKSVPSALLMVVGVLIVEVLKMTIGVSQQEIFLNMQLYVIMLVGVVNLFFVCRPFNLYKVILFTLATLLISFIIIFSACNIIPFINNFFIYIPMLPLKNYWPHLLTVVAIGILSIALSLIIQKLFEKINFRINLNFFKKKK